MSEWMRLTAADGHELSAYVARPAGTVRGALVLVQEIFGVNSHIQSVCDRFAGEGYLVVAPALFDRFEQNVQLTYEGDDQKRAYELMGRLTPETTLMDVAAAFSEAAKSGAKTGVIGYCYGGLTAWWSATRGASFGITPKCSVGYYAGGIGGFAAEKPVCPVMLHFGEDDSHIGREQWEAVKDAHPEVQIFTYADAGHAFNRDVAPSYVPEAAALALERTLAFFREHLG